MTTPTGLNLVWADAGGSTNPGNDKYQLGWVAEIPTYENFNYVLQALDKAKLAYAESDIYKWQDHIAYIAGARVMAGEKTFYCITPHNDSIGSNPQDPLLDTTNSYWVNNIVFSSLTDAFTRLKSKDGLKLEQTSVRLNPNLWEGNDITIENKNIVLALNTLGNTNNLLFGNVGGKLVVVNVKDAKNPDSRDIKPENNKDSFYIYHEGNRPKQEDIEGTIPKNPEDGKLYARRGNNWEEVSTTTVSLAPPPPVRGSGGGWYNLEDGKFYLDINDGDSSQWVPANPPVVPELVAKFVDYENKNSWLKSKNVQDAIDEIAGTSNSTNKNLIINGDFSIWQRDNIISFDNREGEPCKYIADRYLLILKGLNYRAQAEKAIEDGIADFIADTALYLNYEVDQSATLRQVIDHGKYITDNKDVTVSFWLNNSSSTEDSFILKLGDEETVIYFSTYEGWNKYSYTFKKKVRNFDNSKQHINLDLIFKGAAIMRLTYMKLELSVNSTVFEVDYNGDTLRACQRYFYKIRFAMGSVLPMSRIGTASEGSDFRGLFILPVTMASKPWITMFPKINSFTFWNVGGDSIGGSITGNEIDKITVFNDNMSPLEDSLRIAHINFKTENQDFSKYRFTGPFACGTNMYLTFDSELR